MPPSCIDLTLVLSSDDEEETTARPKTGSARNAPIDLTEDPLPPVAPNGYSDIPRPPPPPPPSDQLGSLLKPEPTPPKVPDHVRRSASTPSDGTKPLPLVESPPIQELQDELSGLIENHHSHLMDIDDAQEQQNLQHGSEQDQALAQEQQDDSQFSFSSNSPLAARHRARKMKTRHDTSPRAESPRAVMARGIILQKPDNAKLEDNLEERLVKFRRLVRENHAETVNWLLYDTRTAMAERNPPFTSAVCPFATIKAVNISSSQPLSDGMTKLKVDTIITRKKTARTSSYVLTSELASDLPRVPKYSSYTTVKRNLISPDNEQLRYIPFLFDSKGDAEPADVKRLHKELDDVYKTQRSSSSPDLEMASHLDCYLDGWLKELDLGLNRQDIVSFIINHESDSLNKSQKETRRIQKELGGSIAPDLARIASMFSGVFDKVFEPTTIAAVVFSDRRLKELREKASKGLVETSSRQSHSVSPKSQNNEAKYTTDRLGTYVNLLCMICGAISCQTHGDYNRVESSDSEESEPDVRYNHEPVALQYDDIRRAQDVRLYNNASTKDLIVSDNNRLPCSEECYLKVDTIDKEIELSREDVLALKSFMISMRPSILPCNIASLRDIPCWMVSKCIKDMIQSVRDMEPPPRGYTKVDWYDNKRKVLKSDWQDLTTAHLHQMRSQIRPCAHIGPCTGRCPCADNNILCESFCGCPDDCSRRFTGCNCHASGLSCVSETCICIAMNRECGSQCVSCGAVPRIDLRNKYNDDLYKSGCQNVYLQRGVDRSLLIGESQLEGVGFGLYLGEAVQKAGYLSEYKGEVISFAEADRRGVIYDRKYSSFLFDLNSEWCIDAARLGNKTRFINHAEIEHNGLNCEAKIFLVNGEHRIKFVALRDIKAGEELLFDYGKKFAEKHGLNKKLPKATKEGKKKGVVEGEDALEALDGNRARGKWTATRGRGSGGGSGRGGRKATKSAPMKRVPETEAADEEDEDMLDYEDLDDEDEEDDIVPTGRRKRKINRPKRYSR